MNQLEFKTAETKVSSQCDSILARLHWRADWVPMPELVECSGSYNVHSRIAELRKRGYQIEQRSEREGRTVKSSYRIV
jgi:hypothetical protein